MDQEDKRFKVCLVLNSKLLIVQIFQQDGSLLTLNYVVHFPWNFPLQAQKPWAKKYDKVMKAKDEFHKACKSLRTAEINERNQQADTSISEDQVRTITNPSHRVNTVVLMVTSTGVTRTVVA